MKKKQEKSSCCDGNIIGHGAKRKKCVACGRTWSLWKKKRGRKKVRADVNIVQQYLNGERASSARMSTRRKVSESSIQNRVTRSRDVFIRTTPWREVPDGDLILIADAVVELIGRSWMTAYLMLVRSVEGDTAVILPPRFIRGRETPAGWSEAIDGIDPAILSRIKALVCDGHAGLTSQSMWRKWLLQRCHFHLIASIRARRARTPMARHHGEAHTLMAHARIILTDPDERTVTASLSVIEEVGWLSSSKIVRKVISGFVRNHRDYRTYLEHPKLNLPTTSNSAESVASLIGNTKRRLRGFKTARSFELWVVATLKLKGVVKCRKNPQN